MSNNVVIAIDGHSSCGKSTVAKTLAKMLGYIYVDTGAMYRAVTYFCMKENLIDSEGVVNEHELKLKLENVKIEFKASNDGNNGQLTYLNQENIETAIRGLDVSNMVSYVSKIKFVRDFLVMQQRQFGESQNIVMDGRDIGTVVFPKATVKIFMTAKPEVRAQRRYDELQAKGETVQYDEILKNVKERDFLDSTRKESPLRPADDSILLDNSEMTREEQFSWILEKIKI